METLQISQQQAAKIGIGFFTFNSGLVIVYYYCKKTNLILKIKKLGFIYRKNKEFFFQTLFIISLLKPELLYFLWLKFRNVFSQCFSFFLNINFFNDVNLLYLIGLFFFYFLVKPIIIIFTIFVNFLLQFHIKDSYFFVNLYLFMWYYFWYFAGFFFTIRKNFKKDFYRLLAVFFGTFFLLFNSLILPKEEKINFLKILKKECQKIFDQILLYFYSDLLLKIKNGLTKSQKIVLLKIKTFNKLCFYNQKSIYILKNLFNLTYFLCLIYLKFYWVFNFFRSVFFSFRVLLLVVKNKKPALIS